MIPWLLQPAWASFTWQIRRLPLSSFFSATEKKKKHWQAEFIVLFYFSPKEAILSFAVTAPRLRLRLLLGSDKVKQPAPCYQGKGHLFKVSGLEGFRASKSPSLFSTHHFYGTGRKSDIQILQTETELQWSPFRHPCTAARPFLKPISLFVSFNWLCRRFLFKNKWFAHMEPFEFLSEMTL